jgi:hypothetical protein
MDRCGRCVACLLLGQISLEWDLDVMAVHCYEIQWLLVRSLMMRAITKTSKDLETGEEGYINPQLPPSILPRYSSNSDLSNQNW